MRAVSDARLREEFLIRRPGARPDLVIGLDQSGTQQTFFEGFVLEAELEYEPFGSYTIRIQGVTRTYRLDLSTRHAYYRKKTMKDIADQVVSDDGLEAEVKSIKQHGWDPNRVMNYVQWGESDYAFLNRLADDNWAWTRPTKDGIEICGEFQEESKIKWLAEDGLLQFSIKGKLGQPAFSGAYYDVRTAEPTLLFDQRKDPEFFDGEQTMSKTILSESPFNISGGSLYAESRAPSQEEYKQLLEKESVRTIGGKIFGCGISRAMDLKPGNKLSIEGVVDASGAYGIIAVVHKWVGAGDSAAAPRSAHRPAADGHDHSPHDRPMDRRLLPSHRNRFRPGLRRNL